MTTPAEQYRLLVNKLEAISEGPVMDKVNDIGAGIAHGLYGSPVETKVPNPKLAGQTFTTKGYTKDSMDIVAGGQRFYSNISSLYGHQPKQGDIAVKVTIPFPTLGPKTFPAYLTWMSGDGRGVSGSQGMNYWTMDKADALAYEQAVKTEYNTSLQKHGYTSGFMK